MSDWDVNISAAASVCQSTVSCERTVLFQRIHCNTCWLVLKCIDGHQAVFIKYVFEAWVLFKVEVWGTLRPRQCWRWYEPQHLSHMWYSLTHLCVDGSRSDVLWGILSLMCRVGTQNNHCEWWRPERTVWSKHASLSTKLQIKHAWQSLSTSPLFIDLFSLVANLSNSPLIRGFFDTLYRSKY